MKFSLLHTCVEPCCSVAPAWTARQAFALQLGMRTRFPQCLKSSFLIIFQWQEAFLWKARISKFGELGTYWVILHNSHKYGEMWGSTGRARCQDCPLHRRVGTVLHDLGLSAHHLISDTTTHSNHTAKIHKENCLMKSNSQNNVVWLASYLKSVYNHVLMLLNIMNTHLYKCLIMFWIKYQSRLSHNILQQWEITIRYLVTF